MTTKLCQVVFDAHDPKALAMFWKDLLGFQITIDRPDEVEIGSDREGDVPIGFIPNDEPKRAKNRLHLDLGSASEEHQRETVQRALDLGGSHCDIGQGERRWTVMSDPEGNEFCVLPARDPDIEVTGPVATICLDADDTSVMGRFWSAATGWEVLVEGDWGVALAPTPWKGPSITLGPKVAPKSGKNRLHLDIAPPIGGTIDAEAERLIALGATRVDIGQGDVPWTVLADPEGNEFCILTPR